MKFSENTVADGDRRTSKLASNKAFPNCRAICLQTTAAISNAKLKILNSKVRLEFAGAVLTLMLGVLFWQLPEMSAQEPLFGNYFAHDPSTLIKDGNRYFFFRTDQGISINWSDDLRNWNSGGRIFPGNPPTWTTNAVPGFTGDFWAPDVAFFNGDYHVYYSISEWGTIDSAIGLVTTPSLISPTWTDHGKVIQSDATWEAGPDTDVTSFNCIDPSILVDTNGSIWMSFGSYSDGILVMQLDPATGKRISPNSPLTKIADNGSTFFSNTTEGSFLYQHGGYYYLFLNFGSCCSGIDSTYNIRIGRSANVTGPFLDRNGVNLLNGGGTMLLESTGRFIGPGHAGILNDNGTYWFSYHYYDGNNFGAAKLGLARLEWTDGWPAVTNDWSAFYTFDADAREHLGIYNGNLQSGATIANAPARGNVLSLDGTSNYVSLPIPVANASTFAAWVKWNGGNDWQRVFDFGEGTAHYIFLTPRANNGKMRLAIRNGGAEQIVDAPFALPTNSWAHVAVTLDGARSTIYLNGESVASTNNITIRPWQLLARSNYLGKSQFAADPTFAGKLDSVRIFGRALAADEIRELAWAHPGLAHRYSFKDGVRDSIGMAHGRLMGNAIVTNGILQLNGAAGDYVNLPGGLVSGSSALTIEFWAEFRANGNWARVFDFGNINGNNGQRYIFYSPHNGVGGQRMELSTSPGTTTLDVPGNLDGRAVHVVCIFDPANSYEAIYTNGVLQVEQNTPLPPLNGVSAAWGFIGRSLFASDAWLNADIDELRIYDARLTPEEIAANELFGPNALALPLKLEWANVFPDLNFSWPAYGIGFQLQSASELHPTSGWLNWNQNPTLENDRWHVSVPVGNNTRFFRLRR